MDEFIEVKQLLRAALKCKQCFSIDDVEQGFIDIAQPRLIGPKYFIAHPRILIMMLNPGNREDYGFRQSFYDYNNGKTSLRELFAYQSRNMSQWGKSHGHFSGFYFDDMGISRDEAAFVNIAWCETRGNEYPPSMLNRCFTNFTLPLIKHLTPHVIILSGVNASKYKKAIASAIPNSPKFIETLHYAHRKGKEFQGHELSRVRKEICQLG